MKKFTLGLAAGLLAVIGLAVADANYYGWNPSTNLEIMHGVLTSGGTQPAVTGVAGCGTLTAKVGGASVGSVTIGTFSSTCALTITPATAALNGYHCTFTDRTTVADSPTEAVTVSKTACSSTTGTVVTGDVVVWTITGY